MLLIRCPYCEMDRPELEFRYGGEAHVARPPDPSKTSDEEWAGFSTCEPIPKDCMRSAGGTQAVAAGSSTQSGTRLLIGL